MLLCHNCGLIEEPRTVREQVGEYWGGPYYEERQVCPYCGDDLEEAPKCDICGEEIEEGMVCSLCQAHIEAIEEHIDDIVNSYNLDKAEFIQHLINYLER